MWGIMDVKNDHSFFAGMHEKTLSCRLKSRSKTNQREAVPGPFKVIFSIFINIYYGLVYSYFRSIFLMMRAT